MGRDYPTGACASRTSLGPFAFTGVVNSSPKNPSQLKGWRCIAKIALRADLRYDKEALNRNLSIYRSPSNVPQGIDSIAGV